MGSSSKLLQLKLMSCKDLKAFNFFQKLQVYAIVSLVGDDSTEKKLEKQQQRTPTDTEGDGNPEWNHEMQFDLGLDNCDENQVFLHFDLRFESALFGDKSLGEVRILLKDLVDDTGGSPKGILRFVSYEVRTSDGKPNGVVNFSSKLLTTCDCDGTAAASGGWARASNSNVQIEGYPIVCPSNQALPLPLHNPYYDQTHQPQLPPDSDDQLNCSSSPPSRVHYPSLLPEDYSHTSPMPSPESYYFPTAVVPHQVHDSSFQASFHSAALAGDARVDYLQPPHSQFHYASPIPPPPPPVALPLPSVLPYHLSPSPQPPPFALLPSHPPPPPPHTVHGATIYHPKSHWAYEPPYPKFT